MIPLHNGVFFFDCIEEEHEKWLQKNAPAAESTIELFDQFKEQLPENLEARHLGNVDGPVEAAIYVITERELESVTA